MYFLINFVLDSLTRRNGNNASQKCIPALREHYIRPSTSPPGPPLVHLYGQLIVNVDQPTGCRYHHVDIEL